ncbi:fatty acid-binding protein 1, liver-like [Diadema setosum]|uniref:fatty acid-binding protein 1, liver-like n=1 Tax=Diadema setosum TaxID=31175 RepID=UPI003B3B3AFF
MPADFSGTWSIDKHDSFDALLDLLAVPAEKRPPFPITQLTVEITQNGDNMHIKSTTAQGCNDYSFDVGSEFETNLVVWMPKMKVTSAWEGDSVVLTNEQGFKLSRSLEGGQMVTTMGKGDTTAKVYFNKTS